jgi:hypothetical protein
MRRSDERQHCNPRHMMRDNIATPDTWCPIAGFRSFKIFLAMAARYKQRIYQLDYVAAFLQADVIGRKFTILPTEWKQLFTKNKEIHEWLSIPCWKSQKSVIVVC